MKMKLNVFLEKKMDEFVFTEVLQFSRAIHAKASQGPQGYDADRGKSS